MCSTWLTDWETLAVNTTSWKKFMKKVCQWQDEKEKNKRRYSSVHEYNVQQKEMRMTRKAVVDTMNLDFTGGRAKCPHCQMKKARSGLAVHFARCSQMNEEQRRIATAARIRETGRMRIDLSVELCDTKGKAQRVSRDFQPEKMDATDPQKKLTEMVKTAKEKQTRWKEERSVAQPPPPFFHAGMGQRGIKTTVSGNVAFRGRFQSWLQDEYRYSTRAPPQRVMDRSFKGENCSTWFMFGWALGKGLWRMQQMHSLYQVRGQWDR